MDDRKLLQDALHDAAKEWSKPDPEEMETLLRKIRAVLEQPSCWRPYGALEKLRNDINDLLGE